MLEEGLSYPFNGDSALGRIIIGGLLGFGSFLIVPAIALMGYLVWVLDGAARGEEEPPDFENWGDMIVDGLKATAVAIVYGIVPFVLVFLSVFVIAGGSASGSETGMGILGGIGLLGMLVSMVAMFVLYYLIPAALTNMALEDSFGAAFDFGTIKQVILTGDYLVAWLIPFVLAALMNVVVFLLAITVVGLVVVPFIQFYVQVAAFYMFGVAFGKVVDVPGAVTDDSAAL
ncbi:MULTISPECIES: DUF4013 domain-containing protein [Halolamina]|uniref:DUF4013 domain-containing protein n=1 Tax=Halolamina pelagica TaxID=699431 RepID=A0A1I5R9B5_9EURY|nr:MULTISPECIES: DUF4013 domain-containing protein [Halolamina]NHX35728.1 DUF4013 domain-containing protein [Halolamina sp. R1-12]SFP54606.1 Protein of unknown function [Halolamina pelagica]